MDNNRADETSYTTKYEDVFLKNVEDEYCTKHRNLCVMEAESVPSNNLLCSAMAFRSSQFSYDPYDLSTYDEE